MTEERIDVIPENNSMPVMQEGNSSQQIPENDSASLVPVNDPPLVILENIEPKSGHMRRYSTGNVAIPYTRVKILSRYLELSTGSCHDFCKYGMKQALERNSRSPLLERITETQREGQDMQKVLTSAERKKKLALTPSCGSRSQKPDIRMVTKREFSSSTKKEIILSKQRSLPLGRIDVSKSSASGPKLKSIQSKPSSFPEKGSSSNKEESEIQENKEMGTSLMSSHGVLSSRQKTELRRSKVRSSIGSEKKVLVRPTVSVSVKKVLMRPIVSSFPKRLSKRVSSMNTEKFKNQKGVSLLKDQSDFVKDECVQHRREDVPEKTFYIIEVGNENKTAAPSESGDHASGFSSSSSLEDKSLKSAENGVCTAQLSPPSTRKILRCTQNRNPATQPLLSSENRCLRCHRYETCVNRSFKASSKPIHSSSSSECHEAEIKNRVVNKLESKTRPRKGGLISTKDKVSPGGKVNFGAGKVVELEPVVSSSRRLKFRRRVLDDSQIGKVDTKKIKLRNPEVVDGETNVAKHESVKIALKHHNVQRKKNVRTLLNSMIEETASKLAKTRKSKVKALVGAFETVISLQDSKTFSRVRAC